MSAEQAALFPEFGSTRQTTTTDSEAVKAWRDHFRLNCSPGRKQDIDLTVTDLALWRDVLRSWGYHRGGKWIKFNPLAIGHQLSEYERRERLQNRTPNYPADFYVNTAATDI